jgi:hypothetical protein
MVTCTYCRAICEVGQKFCGSCGKRLEFTQAQANTQQTSGHYVKVQPQARPIQRPVPFQTNNTIISRGPNIPSNNNYNSNNSQQQRPPNVNRVPIVQRQREAPPRTLNAPRQNGVQANAPSNANWQNNGAPQQYNNAPQQYNNVPLQYNNAPMQNNYVNWQNNQRDFNRGRQMQNVDPKRR